MKSSITGHHLSHPLFKHRYVARLDAQQQAHFSTLQLENCQILKVRLRFGFLAIRISSTEANLPNQASKLRMLGQRHARDFVKSLGLAIATNPEKFAFTIVQLDTNENSEPEYHVSENLVILRTKTFDDHHLPFSLQTTELALLIATQLELIRSSERVLGEHFGRMRMVAMHRKLLWAWFIQEEPASHYAKATYKLVWEYRDIRNRLTESMQALDSKTNANNGVLFLWLAITSTVTAIWSVYISLRH